LSMLRRVCELIDLLAGGDPALLSIAGHGRD
jgi:hypothetical protein